MAVPQRMLFFIIHFAFSAPRTKETILPVEPAYVAGDIRFHVNVDANYRGQNPNKNLPIRVQVLLIRPKELRKSMHILLCAE